MYGEDKTIEDFEDKNVVESESDSDNEKWASNTGKAKRVVRKDHEKKAPGTYGAGKKAGEFKKRHTDAVVKANKEVPIGCEKEKQNIKKRKGGKGKGGKGKGKGKGGKKN